LGHVRFVVLFQKWHELPGGKQSGRHLNYSFGLRGGLSGSPFPHAPL
jgi:hypothetical protein